MHARALFAALLLVACSSPPPPSDAGGDAGCDCESAGDCDDGLFCNGVETCGGSAACGRCEPGPAACAAGQACDEANDLCTTVCEVTEDADGDGARAIVCGGMDCDDSDPAVHPGAAEVCDLDAVDEDCDPTTRGERDVDGDGEHAASCCNGTACELDCDDSRRGVHSRATETCNELDDDCDGAIDEGLLVAGFVDADWDGSGNSASPIMACPGARLFAAVDGDCDDRDPAVRRGWLEICDGRDNNCDGSTDEGAVEIPWYVDADGDGWGIASASALPMVSCMPIGGRAIRSGDCDDADAMISPTAPERCNARDDDCDGRADYAIERGDGEDDDRDGTADARCGLASRDCDDRDPLTFPAASEICDDRDNDCDGTIDDGTAEIAWHRDADGDAFGDPADAIVDCEIVSGRLPRGGDCDDADPSVHPDALDDCGGHAGVDDDCDTMLDESLVPGAVFADFDTDGWGAGEPMLVCARALGYSTEGGDCAPTDNTRSPGHAEDCDDTIDQDCDDAIDCDDPACFADAACAEIVRLVVTAGGDQTVPLGAVAPLPIEVRASDLTGTAIPMLDVTMSAPGASTATPTSRTDGSGVARFVVRAGVVPGTDTLRFTAAGARPVTTTLITSAPPAGTIGAMVNASRADGFAGVPGAAADAVIGRPTDLAIASDGTTYVVDEHRHRLYQVGADGRISLLAGNGEARSAGDFGPALDASFIYPRAIALDEARDLLYVAEGDRIRRIDLATRTIEPAAGPGTSTLDGVLASTARVSNVCAMTVDATGDLYYAEGSGWVRRLDAGTRVVRTLLASGDGTPEVTFGGVAGNVCGVVRRAGELVVGGYVSGTEAAGSTIGIVALDLAGGALRLLAGDAGGLTVPGQAARSTQITSIFGLAIDPGGNVYYSQASTYHDVRRIDAASGIVTAIAGDTTSASSGDGGPASAARLQSPSAIAIAGDRLIVAEPAAHVVRTLWGIDTVPEPVRVVAVAPTTRTATITAQVALPLTVRSERTDGSAISGIEITWRAGDPAVVPIPTRALTSLGTTATFPRLGRALGDHTIDAIATDLWGAGLPGSPVRFTVTAAAPATGEIVTLVNVVKSGGALSLPAPATIVRTSGVRDVTVASSGDVYVAIHDHHTVVRVTPSGMLERVAGNGAAGSIGDGVPATSAQTGYVHLLALDEPRGRLYLVSGGSGAGARVRWVDLATGLIHTLAGGGIGAPTYGDGGPASAAGFSSVQGLAVTSDGAVWIGDADVGVRRVDPVTGVITRRIVPGTGSGACAWCSGSASIAVDGSDRVLVAGYFGGTDLGGTAGCVSQYPAIARFDPATGTMTLIAGQASGGSTAEDAIAIDSAVPVGVRIGAGTDGTVTWAEAHRVRRIDPTTGRVRTVAGSAMPGGSGDFGPGTAALLYTPDGTDFAGGHVYIADQSNGAVRLVW